MTRHCSPSFAQQNPKQGILLATDAYSIFMLDNEARRFTPSTLEYYRYRLRPFLDWCAEQGVDTVDGITATHVRTYLASLHQRNLAGYSVLAAARAIRAFFGFCVREGWLEQSPMRRVQMPRVEKQVMPAFTHEQLVQLQRAVRTSRERALILFLLDTGIRAAECVALNGGDINLATGEIRVLHGKGQKERTVYVGAKARRQLLRYFMDRGRPDDDGAVWVSHNDKRRLSRSGFFRTVRDLGQRAGVVPCTPHMFRRTFALMSLRNGMNIYVLQRLMGHEDLAVLQRYLALVDTDLASAHKAAGVVDNL